MSPRHEQQPPVDVRSVEKLTWSECHYICCTSNVALALYFYFLVAFCVGAPTYGFFYVYYEVWTPLAKELHFDAFYSALFGVPACAVLGVGLALYERRARARAYATIRRCRDGCVLVKMH